MFRSVANKNLPISLGSCIFWTDGPSSYPFVFFNGASNIYSNLIDRSGNGVGCISTVDFELNANFSGFRGNILSITNGEADVGGGVVTYGSNVSFFAALKVTGANGFALSSSFGTFVASTAVTLVSGTSLTGSTAVNDGSFHTIAGTIASTNGNVYVDGVNDGSQSGMNDVTGTVFSGLNFSSTCNVAEIIIYNKTLSASEVKFLHRYALNRWA